MSYFKVLIFSLIFDPLKKNTDPHCEAVLTAVSVQLRVSFDKNCSEEPIGVVRMR